MGLAISASSRSRASTFKLAGHHQRRVGPHTLGLEAADASAVTSEGSTLPRRVREPDGGVVIADAGQVRYRARPRASEAAVRPRGDDAATLATSHAEQPAHTPRRPPHARVQPLQKRRRSLEPSPCYAGTPVSPDEAQLLVGLAVLLEVRRPIRGSRVHASARRGRARLLAVARGPRVTRALARARFGRARRVYTAAPPPLP